MTHPHVLDETSKSASNQNGTAMFVTAGQSHRGLTLLSSIARIGHREQLEGNALLLSAGVSCRVSLQPPQAIILPVEPGQAG